MAKAYRPGVVRPAHNSKTIVISFEHNFHVCSLQYQIPEWHQLHLQPGGPGYWCHRLGHPVHLPHHHQRGAGEWFSGVVLSHEGKLCILLNFSTQLCKVLPKSSRLQPTRELESHINYINCRCALRHSFLCIVCVQTYLAKKSCSFRFQVVVSCKTFWNARYKRKFLQIITFKTHEL